MEVELLLQPGRPVEDARAGLVEPRGPGGVIRGGHRGRGIEQEDQPPPRPLVALQAQDRTEQEQDDQQDGGQSEGQQEPPPRGHDLAEDPPVRERSQNDGGRGDRQHGQQAVTLFERQMDHGTPGQASTWKITYSRILSGSPSVVNRRGLPDRPPTRNPRSQPLRRNPLHGTLDSAGFPETGPSNA